MNQDATNKDTTGAAAIRATGSAGRFSAAMATWSIDRRVRADRKREHKLVADAGAAVVASTPLIDLKYADAHSLRTQAADVTLRINALDLALRESLDKDRQDYAKASQLMRWIVVGRGVMDRWILQDRIRFHRREHARLLHEIGTLAFDNSHDALLEYIPGVLCDGVAQARTAIASAQAEREKLLAPWNGNALPPWLCTAVRECRAFLYHLWDQFSRRLFLRVPAIGALLASWWIAHTYTSDLIERIQYSMGLGGRAPMHPQTLKQLSFFVPIAAAGVVAYVTNAIARRVQRKYAIPK